MTTEKNTAIVRRLFEEVMKGNLAIADEFIAAPVFGENYPG